MTTSRFTPLRRLALAALAFVLVPAGAALAQVSACRSIEAELASLDRGAAPQRGGRYARQAAQARANVQRLSGYMASIGCDRPQVFIFGSGAPPECGPMRAQLQQAQGRLAALEGASRESYGDPSAVAARRRQLLGALDSYGCRSVAAAPPRERGFFDQLFGRPDQRIEPRGTYEVRPQLESPPDDQETEEASEPRAAGGSKPVCVRSCDGYFFPLEVSGARARAAGDELCRALCPGSEARLYFMQPGGDIEQAVSSDGENYSSLPNALKYRTSFDSTCACKERGQSWASVLKGADEVLGAERRGDVIVTPEASLQSAQPLPPAIPDKRGRRKAEPPQVAGQAGPPPPALRGTAPAAASPEPPKAGDEVRKGVRVIAPELSGAQRAP